MSSAQIWAALQQSAMVGVDRLPLPQIFTQGADGTAPASQQALQTALAVSVGAGTGQAAALQLLRASGVAAVLERAGWLAGQGRSQTLAPLAPAPAPVPAETRPAPESPHLQALMREVLRDGAQDLLAPMFAALDGAGQRLPHGLLAQALEQGRQSVALRHWLTPVLGERGRWLAALNPQWSYAGGVEETADPEQVWQEGSIDQRLALLHGERRSGPAQARARLEASLKELSAKERAPMVMTLETGLSMADEPLLEKLLGDRSKEVRENAARLLSRLPQSGHSQRITGWLQAMLSRNAKGEWQIEPPEEGSKDWERDGIALQPPAYIKGVKAWWLQQMVGQAPVAFWIDTLGMTPEQLWEWSRRSDWKTALRQGWLAALRDQHDVRWIALLQTMDRDARVESLLPALLNQLSQEQREALWQAQLQQAKGTLIERINAIESGMPAVGEFSLSMSERLMDELDKALGGKQVTGSWHSWQADQALLACARRLHAAVLPRLARLWRKPSATAADLDSATDSAGGIALTPEQQARLERARLRPWDDERVLAQLNRCVDLRVALHAALSD
ncbi:DUF5691 domain-containing protein [Comamonas guangdongensis]|uniref:DUF5691 domain-containing protein n=1 Tax=Comamonas guangdongensis TaxID=510515 RepID=A0ABV3ZX69_9BURK